MEMNMDVNIDNLGLNDLRILNKKVVERLRYIQQMNTNSSMQNFEPGDTVCFDTTTGEVVSGKIIKFNKKTISVLTEDNIQYNVSPQLLNKVVEVQNEAKKTAPVIQDISQKAATFMLENHHKFNSNSLAKNAPCFCGSGKKFKRCCLLKMKQ